MNKQRKIRIATRGSELALVQTRAVCERLSATGFRCEIVEITTKGDRDRETPLSKVGQTGIFTKAVEDALFDGRADVAVHSAKDMPTQLTEGLRLAAALPREDPRDALVSADGTTLAKLPAGALVGTSSPRRAAFIRRLRPDLTVESIRGNVPTRIEKVQSGRYAAAVLALAGLRRLGLEKSVTEVLETDIMLPAAGQGAIVVEMRAGDALCAAVEAVSDADTFACGAAERAVIRRLEAGCSAAVGALAACEGDGFHLKAAVLSVDGRSLWQAERRFHRGEEEKAGRAVADDLLRRGAGEAIGDYRV